MFQAGNGSVSPYADGVDLESLFEQPAPPLIETVQIALVIAHALDVLHQSGVAHGDIHLKNVKVKREAGAWRVALIDLDGFAAPGFPAPVAGAYHYMAPEIFEALEAKKPVQVDMRTDR